MLVINKSKALLERAYKVIPSATQTFSKGPSQWPHGVAPSFLVKGEGAWVWDVDGNRYLDHLMALGAVILGYNNEEANEAIKKQINSGTIFSQMHPLEVELAEKLVSIIPSAEMVKFYKNGSDATTAAVRVARAYTDKNKIVFCGYHGWHDWHIALSSRSAGIPDFNQGLSFTFEYNNIDSLKALLAQHVGEIAAVIMEPVGVEKPQPGFLESVRELCSKNGIILIFDEIVTGFRFNIGGFQAISGVIPDLACFGKGIANGMPLAVLVGNKNIMELFDTHIFVSSTFGGETASLAAGLKTIEILERDKVLESINTYASELERGITKVIIENGMQSHIKFCGYPIRSILTFTNTEHFSLEAQKTYLMQESVKEGLLYFCSHVPCWAHGKQELDFTLTALNTTIAKYSERIRQGNLMEHLEAEIIKPIFRKG